MSQLCARRSRRCSWVLLYLLLSPLLVRAQEVTTPLQEFGFQLGADYQLANYQQLLGYWKKLEQESDRLALRRIGTSAEGRPIWMAVITSPQNQLRIEHYRSLSRRLALAQDVGEAEARRMAREGKAIVWIDGGLHATETLGAQQLMEFVYQMVSGRDPETLRFLDDVILLAVCVNPDGLDLVADWYMRESEPTARTLRALPRLYQKYTGHDNNRDFFMVSQPETEAINRVLYREWFPQIVYNHHQAGPRGTVLFAPPFRGPFNYNIDPLVITSIDLIGAAMHGRFVAEGKAGATMRGGAGYSTWWNGGLRTTPYFHNMMGLLTETVGHPTPMKIPFIPSRQLPSGDLPLPIAPRDWHFREAVDYSITANRAVLDTASRHREQFLLNSYRMGRNSIQKGSRDSWTARPEVVKAVVARAEEDGVDYSSRGSKGVPATIFEPLIQDPKSRDPRAYVLSSAQPDFLTAVKFANALIKNGVTVHRASQPFEIENRPYPAGSLVVTTAQAFRPHILDMFEPQTHPDDFHYPGGPPIPPYDSAGWTLAFQMGVEFDRILGAVDTQALPLRPVSDSMKPPPGRVSNIDGAGGFLFSHNSNDAFVALNRLLASRHPVRWISEQESERLGWFFVSDRPGLVETLQGIAKSTGVDFQGVETPLRDSGWDLRQPRIGLWDRYGGSIRSGWMRWILEQFEFPYQIVYPQSLDAGDLRERFDVILFVHGGIPDGSGRRRTTPDPEQIPARYRDRLGAVTLEKTIPRLREFLLSGGAVLAIGGSTVLAEHLELPLLDPLTERDPQGNLGSLPREKYFVPGSILRMHLRTAHPLAHGMPSQVDTYFDNSPVFRLASRTGPDDIRVVGWFGEGPHLRSGWAWGQRYLDETTTVLDCRVGEGRLFLYGPQVTFRAQPHGTFKLVFNGIHYGTALANRAPPKDRP